MSSSADGIERLTVDGVGMPYLTNSLMPQASIDDYRTISEALPNDRPEGMVARYVGIADDGLAITVVWTSKAHADRFEAEHLEPTIRRLMGPPDPESDATFTNYEATEVVFGSPEVSA
jgi:hypothetical protein